jgi:hypothetical protein
MSQQELLRKVVETLDGNGIDYMITGSMASSLQGEPRLTHDIDLVVSIREADIGNLVEAFPSPSYYLEAESVREAMFHGSVFTLMDNTGGDKVDFWILTDQPFDQSRFARKRAEDVMGMSVKVSSPEDTILAKMRWVVESGGSEKQFADALHVFEVQRDILDLDYLNKWAAALDIEEIWSRLQNEAEIL